MVYHLQHANILNGEVPEGIYLRMIENESRLNDGIMPALLEQCKDKIVIDLGCGTGLLGLHALKNGAKFVYFVEQNAVMIEILKNVLPKTIDNSKFKIIHKFAQYLEANDFDKGVPELCVSELIGDRLFNEGYYHCSKPLKEKFKDLKFIPNIFHLDIFECDVDYNEWPWPQKEKILLEHYKYLYSTIGWTHNFIGDEKNINSINPKKIGELYYNADTGEFKNTLTAVIRPENGKLINIFGHCCSGNYKQHGPQFGWYVYPSFKKVEISLNISKEPNDSRILFSARTYKKG